MISLMTKAWGWVVKNPLQVFQILAVTGIISALTFFWLDYQAAKDDVDQLERQLAAEKVLTEGQGSRLNEFEKAQKLQLTRLKEVEASQAETARRVKALTDELSSLEIARLIEENPDEAASIVNARLNRLLGMFDDTTASPD